MKLDRRAIVVTLTLLLQIIPTATFCPSPHRFSPTNNPSVPRNSFSQLQSFGDDFINSLLDNAVSDPNDPSNRFTHMIALPLQENHDLLLELESVQRAILYHCPLLINACIAPVLTRMPLLYVDTQDADSTVTQTNEPNPQDFFSRALGSLGSNDDLLTSRDPITQRLSSIVDSVVQEYIFQPQENIPVSQQGETEEDEAPTREGLNADKIQPILMQFQGLELEDGTTQSNEILYAIGKEGKGTAVLRQVLEEISRRIEAQGWKVYLPLDQPHEANDNDPNEWRPRIPFMRLPLNFLDSLPDPKGVDGDWANYSKERKNSYMRVPEEGGNGVSPIFWFNFANDEFCKGDGVRIKEFAVYGRTAPMGINEQSFYIPHLKTKLPEGSQILSEEEEKGKEYDANRRLEQERLAEEEEEEWERRQQRQSAEKGSVGETPFIDVDENSFEKDLQQLRSSADRRMLQTIFDSSPDLETDFESLDIIQDTNNDNRKDVEEQVVDVPCSDALVIDEKATSSGKTTSSDSTHKYEEASEEKEESPTVELRGEESKVDAKESIIRSIEKPIAKGVFSSISAKAKKKPDPKDNPIFQNWKERMTENAANLKEDVRPKLPPFPSDEHFVGIWRLMTTPSGPSIDEERLMGALDTDPSASENLILRVDGTTAGGPILDTLSQHRASGGTWKFFEAEWIGNTDNDDDIDMVQTRLRIRLVIPPEKERVLVMEGEVKRGSLPSAYSISQENMKQLRSSGSFGISPQKKRSKTDSNQINEETKDEVFLQCSGEAWVEDRSGKRSKLGPFSLLKMKNQNEYTYTIPAPRRNQD